MHSKSNITYLLNPAIQIKVAMETPDRTGTGDADVATMSLFRSLAPVSPLTATSSLQYWRQVLAPHEKKRNHLQYLDSKKAKISLMTLAALSSADRSRSGCSQASSVASSSSDSLSANSTTQSSSTAASSTQRDKIRIRNIHTPRCQVENCTNESRRLPWLLCPSW
ncbi:hypothetical protein PI124_g18744 [Phytophthora idaei]|nr:hypothetical protein PI125_g19638 [Phytophthora idaei]KAG3135843.1 hypothetical protein PI126_g18073 [Phytophthora idaei]KAG3236242.1 hypothetical protein PI124_g18744 [Phytophthora idaei]